MTVLKSDETVAPDLAAPADRLADSLAAAWNAADAAAWAAQFADDADFIHVLGGHGAGRADIEAAHRRLFETIYRGSQLRLRLEGVRHLAPDLAIVRFYQTLDYQAPGDPARLAGRPSLVAQRRGGAWQILFFQNTLESAAIAGHPFAPQASGDRA
jgi:uncharacterized protein (TIGR02246 family)